MLGHGPGLDEQSRHVKHRAASRRVRPQRDLTTTSTQLGPGTIFIGVNQADVFFVAPGTQNINTNKHTQVFVNQPFQTTVTHHATLEFTGAGCATAPIRVSGPAVAVVAQPSTNG